MNPIIDPNTLTEEQREAIKDEYDLNVEWEDRSNGEVEKHWYSGRNLTLLWLFGENFLRKENDMKEHYCTYEQAVALKRLGFAEKVNHGYLKKISIEPEVSVGNLKEVHSKDPKNYNDNRKGAEKGLFFCSAPRLDQAAAWMRDCKDTIVIAEPYWESEIEDDSDYLTGKWCFVVWKDGCRILCNFDPNKEDEELWLFDKYEQALSAGIDKALELLGKEVKE